MIQILYVQTLLQIPHLIVLSPTLSSFYSSDASPTLSCSASYIICFPLLIYQSRSIPIALSFAVSTNSSLYLSLNLSIYILLPPQFLSLSFAITVSLATSPLSINLFRFYFLLSRDLVFSLSRVQYLHFNSLNLSRCCPLPVYPVYSPPSSSFFSFASPSFPILCSLSPSFF